jgi:hypothetical protein
VQELTYNYGIDGYAFGNDLQYIALQGDVGTFRARASAAGFDVKEEPGGSVLIEGPDHYRLAPCLNHPSSIVCYSRD